MSFDPGPVRNSTVSVASLNSLVQLMRARNYVFVAFESTFNGFVIFVSLVGCFLDRMMFVLGCVNRFIEPVNRIRD